MCSWVSFMIFFLCLSFNGVSYARHHRKQPHAAATLVGTVYCDTCFRQTTPKSSHFISGATVAVECADAGKPNFRQEVKTNNNGEFKAKLPISISKNIDKIKACSVKLISSNKPYCSVAATATSSQIHYKSKKSGTHIFSAGFFTFKPQLCNQKDFTEKNFPPSLPDPPAPFLPPIDILPPLPIPDLPVSPLVPPLPRLPGVPLLPPIVTRQKTLNSVNLIRKKTFGFPPNPFQPPSLPFQPSPPALVPPVVPSPPPTSLFPPVPGLIPSPPPPAFRVPLPPTPVIPGIPLPPAITTPHMRKITP